MKDPRATAARASQNRNALFYTRRITKPLEDLTRAADTVRRADKLMYANKRQRKKVAKA